MTVLYQSSLAGARTTAGMTQKEMAEKMHVSRQTVANWEKGKVVPKPAQFEMFCRLCNAPKDAVKLCQ